MGPLRYLWPRHQHWRDQFVEWVQDTFMRDALTEWADQACDWLGLQ